MVVSKSEAGEDARVEVEYSITLTVNTQFTIHNLSPPGLLALLKFARKESKVTVCGDVRGVD